MIALLALSAHAGDRYALVAGTSDGGPGRPALRHATTDAERIASVLVDLGGVTDDRLQLLLDPDIDEVRAGLDRLADAVAASEGSEAILYFSGHASPGGLRFGADELAYAELRAAVDRLPAAVRVVVIDGCSSGAVLRTKGGTLEPPLTVVPGMDGVAWLTSSAADEPSQESDALGGSYFTDSLATGLRGAADRSTDGKVTLAEAYTYAYDRTLVQTQRTLGGAQHASFDVRMAGVGDLVLTSLGSLPARLVVPGDLGDSVTVRRVDGPVIAELDGTADAVLAVAPGRYELVVADSGARSFATVTVGGSEPVRVDAGALRPMPDDAPRAKGRKPPVKTVVASIAVASAVGSAIAFDRYATLDRRDMRQPGVVELRLAPFYFFGAMTVMSTTTLVVLEGAP